MLGKSLVTNGRVQVLWILLDLLLWKAVSRLELLKLGHPYTAQSYSHSGAMPVLGRSVICCPYITPRSHHPLGFLEYVQFFCYVSWLWWRFWHAFALIFVFGLLFWISIGTVASPSTLVLISGSAGSLQAVQELPESTAEQIKAKNGFSLHPGDVVSFRRQILVRNWTNSSNFRVCVYPYFNAKCNSLWSSKSYWVNTFELRSKMPMVCRFPQSHRAS